MLPLLEHIAFQQAISGFTFMGKMATEANDLVTSAPNESLYLIRSLMRQLLKTKGVHPKTIQRLMTAIIGQMNEYQEAKATLRYVRAGGNLELRQGLRKSRRKRP